MQKPAGKIVVGALLTIHSHDVKTSAEAQREPYRAQDALRKVIDGDWGDYGTISTREKALERADKDGNVVVRHIHFIVKFKLDSSDKNTLKAVKIVVASEHEAQGTPHVRRHRATSSLAHSA